MSDNQEDKHTNETQDVPKNKLQPQDNQQKKEPEIKKDIADFEKNVNKLKDLLRNKADGENEKRPDGKKGFKQDKNDQPWNKGKTLLIWVVIIFGSVLAFNYLNKTDGIKEFASLNEFNSYLENVKTIEITNKPGISQISGKFKQPILTPGDKSGGKKGASTFRLNHPAVNLELARQWMDQGITVKYKEDGYGVSDIIISILPWILIIFFMIWLNKRMQGGGQNGGRGIFTFGKSRAKLVDDTKRKVTFVDVAGADEAKEELKEVIEFLKTPEKFTEIGAKIPRGILLTGPPGTGKTLLAKAVSGEAGVPFFSMSGADFVEMFVGVGASRVRDLFEQGKKAAPCILFIDELDAVGRHRGTGIGGGNDEREQTLNQLLVEMDGFETNDSVIIIAATNRPDVLDPALLRPGRFDRHIVVDRPDIKAREEIIKVHLQKIKSEENLDISTLAKSTPGMSGADLASIVNEAALLAARKGKKKIETSDLEDAKDKVMMGLERRSIVISDREKEITAYHEAGHVLIAMFTEGSDPVHKVTIIPRGRAMGLTHYLPIEEKHSYSRTYIKGKLHHLFGGRVAEELVFNEITTGASNDIERATDLARKMVCEWGMSDEIGPIHYGVKNEDPFLGRQLTRTTSISEEIGKKIDSAVQAVIFDALEKTRKILNENIEALHKLAKSLLEKETLDAAEINEIVNAVPLAHSETSAQ